VGAIIADDRWRVLIGAPKQLPFDPTGYAWTRVNQIVEIVS
jgi:hypothetical protein